MRTIKQRELLYNSNFQIQLMERILDWVESKHTQEETNEINKRTEFQKKPQKNLPKKSKI